MGKTRKSTTLDEGRRDISTLSNPSNEAIASCLRSRYDTYKIYTNIGSRHLIAINPLKELPINDDQTSLEYVAAYKDASGNGSLSSEPHLFDLVNRVYFHMRRTGSDQNVIIRGESGSGKSEIRNLTIRHLVRLSSHRKESKVQTQIIESQKILDAFASCQTNFNPSASRYGYYGEIQFNERGRMVGSKTLHYFLEKSRVTGASALASPPSEGNFNIFYYLLAGLSPEERNTLQMISVEPSQYPYLARYNKRSILPTDAGHFDQVKTAFKACGFRKEHINRIIQLLSTLLHLGNLVFIDPSGTGTQEAAYVKNAEQLEIVADFLGLDPHALENVLTFKTTMIRKDITTLILNAEQASLQRDDLCQVLYSLLFSWMVERVNSKTCVEEFSSFIGLLDFPGLQTNYQVAGFEQFCINLGHARIQNYMETTMFGSELEIFQSEGIPIPDITIDNSCVDLLTRPKGICDLLNTMADGTRSGKRTYTDSNLMDSLVKFNTTHPAFSVKSSETNSRHFCIQHYTTPVEYSTNNFVAQNNGQISVDFISLFKGGMDIQPSWNTFIVELFAGHNIKVENHPKNSSAIIAAQQSAKPLRAPSQRRSTRRAGNNEKKEVNGKSAPSTLIFQTQAALDELLHSFEEVKLWSIFCILPKLPMQSKANFDTKFVLNQVSQLKLDTIVTLPSVQYVESYTHYEFLERYSHLFESLDTSRLVRTQCELAGEIMNWNTSMLHTTQNKVFLSAVAWRELEDQLRSYEKVEQRQAKDMLLADESQQDDVRSHSYAMAAAAAGLPLPAQQFAQHDDQTSYYSEEESGHYVENDGSYYGSESYGYSNNDSDPKNTMGLLHRPEPVVENLNETEEDESKMSGVRKRWLFFVYFCTWWIPSKFMIWCGRMKRKDIRVAWREKVTLCMLIFFMCAFVIWFLVFFGEIVCPKQNVFSISELQNHGKEEPKQYVAIRGEVFNIGEFANRHYPPNLVPTSSVIEYAGKDATDLFPVQVSALCQGVSGPISPFVSYDYQLNLSDTNGQYHDFRYSSDIYNPNWYYDQMTLLRKNYKVGNMGFEMKAISDQSKSATLINGIQSLRKWAVIDRHIYDLTAYTMGGRFLRGPPDQPLPDDVDTNFLYQPIVDLFMQKSGSDITKEFYKLAMDGELRQNQLVCLRNLFFVGFEDTRNSAKCRFSTYLLLIVTILLCTVIAFKFIAAIRIGGKAVPEEHDKFVICQITCYTEDEESLRKTIDSIATLQYDDKRKLLFVICDGMIMGAGNDKPTPRIVLDILGVDNQVNPEALSFVSLGEGNKQHNMGKIYSGLYEVSGHVVPYIVVAKCGNPRERQKPGNRGKRDSQLILMQFLNRVHYDAPMNPLQLEIYHQMKNVIGVTPSFYEFVLMVDADTEVMKDGLNFLVSSMVRDSKVIGICGETTLSNEKDTWVTMIQVYEYFISHHLIKSFESLFSTVSCLPGCFTMYRIRSVDGKKAMFMSNEMIEDYSINKVDTLHKKNLLHLGEDRYLTTLLLKHFPNFKTKFNPNAQCKTNAPDSWAVLVSQRRRWINSTIHNLGELVFLPGLCGFCCFSMRFVVMLDLISTLAMPAIMGYLGYLIYSIATAENSLPLITIITIAGTYGLQALLFIMKGRWEFIAWMLVSILAMPVFSFYIPVYSYWHFDDFSWGNTRVVVGEKGQKVAVAADEGTFDPKSIPNMKWSEYERALLSEDHWSDNLSQGSSAYTYNSRGNRVPINGSMYGGGGNRMNGNGSVYGGGSETLSVYGNTPMPPSVMNIPRGSTAFDHNSMIMPSSASVPMLPMQSNRSITSFVGQAQSPSFNQPGQYIPMQQTSQFGINNSNNSLMMDGFTMGDNAGPRNEEILVQVQNILSTADLTKITKKQVREELQSIFGVSMASRKDYINACIENILQNRL
ncbi:chitin synthase-domain-containing protein [Pilobolus umbonatus]|nr:chitin synthase-domain-containing protein [Pilobolus umbonatus]